jgi:hypothetical protein
VFGKTIVRRGRARIASNDSWSIDGEDLVQDSIETDAQFPNIVFGDPNWSNYDFTLCAKWERGTAGPRICFHCTSQDDFCTFNIGNWRNKGHEVVTISGGKWGRGPKGKEWYKWGNINKGLWYDIRIEVREDRFRCFLDEELLFQCEDERFKKGRVGLAGCESACRFKDIKVTAPDGTILWNGLPDLPEGPPSVPPSKAEGFVPLFNGKDLTGWKRHPDQLGNWRVKDGVLTGSGAISHLFTERGDFKDFRLLAEVRVNEGGNSGIYFRTPFGLPKGNTAPGGYEAQILHRYHKPTELTGSLQGLVSAPIPALVANEWFTMEIIAVGNELTIKVNDKTTAHYVDEKRTSMQGHFALQVWTPETTVVEFRKIEIKELK